MMDLSVRTDRSTVAAGGASVRTAVRIQPGMTEDDAQRHIALCIDTSGSMSGEKMAQVREGVRWTFGYLADEDYLSIVTFDDEVEVVLPATRWGDMTLDEAEAIVDEMRPGGGTDILAGLRAAYETLADLPADSDTGRRILLLSDGRDDTPISDFAGFARRIRREDGISIPAAGIGEFYDEAAIRTVGTASDAEWVHLARAGDIENFFGRKVETLRTVVAPSPNLEIALPPGAAVGDVLLRQPQVRAANLEQVGETVRVFLPDLLEFETQEVVFTIDAPRCEAGRPFRLADVTLNTPEQTTSTAIDVECVAGTGAAGAGTGNETEASAGTGVETPEVALKHVDTMIRKATGDGDLERAETMLQRATGEGDAAAGSTGSAASTGETAGTADGTAAAGPGDQETMIRDDGPEDEETQIRREAPDDAETKIRRESPGDEETVIRRDSPAGDESESQAGGDGDGSADWEAVDESDSGGPGQTAGDASGSVDDASGGAVDASGSTGEGPGDQETRIRGGSDGPPGSGAAGPGDQETRIRTESVADLSGLVDDEQLDELETVVRSTDEDDLEDRYMKTKIRDDEGR